MKVLDNNWKQIVVDKIIPWLHTNLKWEAYVEIYWKITTQEKFDRMNGKKALKEEEVVINTQTIEEEWVIIETKENTITREQAIESYKEKYWRKPGNWKLETIISKL